MIREEQVDEVMVRVDDGIMQCGVSRLWLLVIDARA